MDLLTGDLFVSEQAAQSVYKISFDTGLSAAGTIVNDDSTTTVLLSEDVADGDFAGWTVVDESSGTSNWSVFGEEARQTSNIYRSNLANRQGTELVWSDVATQS